MTPNKLTRRAALRAGALTGGTIAISGAEAEQEAAEDGEGEPADSTGWTYCLNTSTIRGQKLGIEEEIDLIGKAGYHAIEPWIREILKFQEEGGKLPDLRKRLDDHGLSVESAIGFANWISDDASERAQGMEEAKRDMGLVAQLGGKRIAAPPVGMHKGDSPKVDLDAAAERYGALCELGREMGVLAQVEVWGFSKNLSTLAESMHVAIGSGHPDACLLGDVYHLYKGGSSLDSLRLLGPQALGAFHMNDYPDLPRSEINDKDRVFCGDGVADLDKLFTIFREIGARPVLSLELFNQKYWERDAEEVLVEGLRKMKAAAEA